MNTKMFMVIDDYCDLLCKELDRIVDNNDINPTTLEIGEIISETCKNFEKYRMMKYAEEHQDEYRGYYRDGIDSSDNYNRYPDYAYRNQDGDRHTPGESYNRGMRSYYRGTDTGYNNYGHSPEEINAHVIKELQRAMDQSNSEQAREAIRQQIHKLRQDM